MFNAAPYFPQQERLGFSSRRSSQWTTAETPHYIPTPASFVSPWNAAVNLTCHSEYNSRSASAATHYLPEAHHHRSPPSLLDAINTYTPPFTRNASPVSSPHTDAHATTSSASTSTSSSPQPFLVKEEQPDEDGFIMDIPTAHPQCLAPPTEVPLRATQACPRMRRMMSVFRLNPFAMHAQGGRGVLEPWAGGEARPLEEPPRIFEFQLDLLPDDEEEEETKIERFDDAGLCCAFPEPEPVPQKEEDLDGSSWELYPALSSFDPVLTCPRSLHYQYNAPALALQMPRRWSHPSAAYM